MERKRKKSLLSIAIIGARVFPLKGKRRMWEGGACPIIIFEETGATWTEEKASLTIGKKKGDLGKEEVQNNRRQGVHEGLGGCNMVPLQACSKSLLFFATPRETNKRWKEAEARKKEEGEEGEKINRDMCLHYSFSHILAKREHLFEGGRGRYRTIKTFFWGGEEEEEEELQCVNTHEGREGERREEEKGRKCVLMWETEERGRGGGGAGGGGGGERGESFCWAVVRPKEKKSE